MNHSISSTLRLVVIARWLTILAWALFLAPSHASDKRDILFNIVNQCLNTQVTDYCNRCQSPKQEAVCEGKTTCKATIEIWNDTNEFLAMRDIKMCGCDADFVHGLVIPKAKVTGVEDANRPEAIWAFAWNEALRLIEQSEIALAVNPQFKRSQDQLHIHIVRLKTDTKARLNAQPLINVKDLNSVWSVAQRAADERRYSDYGVLVFAAAGGGFKLVVTQDSPEHLYTQVRCTP